MDVEYQALEHDPLLVAWRRRAADVVILAGVVLHLPTAVMPVVVNWTDFGPVFVGTFVAMWLVSLAALLARGMDHRARVWLYLGSAYVMSFVGSLAMPEGPLMRAWPVLAPVIAIGLLGARESRIAVAVSAIALFALPITLSSPIAELLPRVGLRSPESPDKYLLLQGIVLVAEMAIIMILLDRHHAFLLRSIASERRAVQDHAAAAARLENVIREQRQLEKDIAIARDEERRRLGNDLHDGVCQQLAGALLRCHALEIGLERGASASVQDVRALSSLLGDTITETHAVAQGLWPLDSSPMALKGGLGRLVKQVRETHGARCEFTSDGNVEVADPGTAQHLFRIAQEALGNAVRHARADRISVRLTGSDGLLTLRVQDDGAGFDRGGVTGGLGLRTMTYRSHVIGGDLDISSEPGTGTRIECRVPRSESLRKAEEAEPYLADHPP